MLTICKILLYVAIGLVVEALGSEDSNRNNPNWFIVLIWPVVIALVIFDLSRIAWNSMKNDTKRDITEVRRAMKTGEDDLDDWNI